MTFEEYWTKNGIGAAHEKTVAKDAWEACEGQKQALRLFNTQAWNDMLCTHSVRLADSCEKCAAHFERERSGIYTSAASSA